MGLGQGQIGEVSLARAVQLQGQGLGPARAADIARAVDLKTQFILVVAAQINFLRAVEFEMADFGSLHLNRDVAAAANIARGDSLKADFAVVDFDVVDHAAGSGHGDAGVGPLGVGHLGGNIDGQLVIA